MTNEKAGDDEFESMTQIAKFIIEVDRNRRARKESYALQETSAEVYLAHAFLKFAKPEAA